MAKIILGFVGPISSGKGEAKNYLENNYQAGVHRFSTVLRDILDRLYLPITRENLQDLSLSLRSCFGSDILARVIADEVKNDPHEIVIIDGVRRLEDITKLKDLPNFYLIAIDAEPKTRYDRLIKRGENLDDSQKTYEEFLADHEREAEIEIPATMTTAKYTIDNNGSLADLYRRLDQIIEELDKR